MKLPLVHFPSQISLEDALVLPSYMDRPILSALAVADMDIAVARANAKVSTF